MLKADQSTKIGITEKVGKPVGQENVVIRKHPQYLEVAIEKSKKDSETKREKKLKGINKDNIRQRKVNYIPFERTGSKHVSEASTTGDKSQKSSGKVKQTDKGNKNGKVGNQQKKSSSTSNTEKWFENKENQKLYEELDRILTDEQSIQKLGNRKPSEKSFEKSSQPIKVVYTKKKPLPRPAEPEVALDYKREPPDRPTRLNKHGFFGPEGTKVWKESEARAREELEKLDNIDKFEFGDFSSRSKKLEAKRRAQFAEYAEKAVDDIQPQVTHTITNGNRIVADIPIYLPALDTSTSRQPLNAHFDQSANLRSDLLGLTERQPVDPLDTYRHHANPVSERILLERAEKERIQLEKETLEYFDTDPGADPDLVPALGSIPEKLRKVKAESTQPGSTVRSAPIPHEKPKDKLERGQEQKAHKNSHSAERRKTPDSNELTQRSRNTYPGVVAAAANYREDSYGKLKYSPQGFQAHLERKARLEKEARILSKAEANRSKWEIEDEALMKRRESGPVVDSKVSGDIKPSMDTYRSRGNGTYRHQGNETQRGYDDTDMTLRTLLNEQQRKATHGQQYKSPVTYRALKETLDRDNETYRERGVDQDRYSDRGANSYRENNNQNKIEGMYSNRSIRKESERFRQDGNAANRTTRQESEDKVEYVLRSKTAESRQSSNSNRSKNKGVQREDTYDAAIRVKMEREVSNLSRKNKGKVRERQNSNHYNNDSRPAEFDDFPRRAAAAEMVASARQEVVEGTKEQIQKELGKYFMEPERQDSKSNIVPLYSDRKSKYSEQKSENREEEQKPQEQESQTSDRKPVKRHAETFGVVVRPDTVEKGINTEFESGDKQTSADNLKIDVNSLKKDKKEKENETEKPGPSAQNKTEVPVKTEMTASKAAPQNHDELTREKTRESTKHKLTRQKTREKTMDSQGPTSEEKLNLEDLETAGFLSLDDIEEGLDENEIYVCYLVTDDGAAIGPLRLDIEDIQIGLPKVGEPKPDTENSEETQEPEKGESEIEGMRNRQTGSHGLNEFSSRSHSMLMLTIDSEMQDPDDENLYITKRGKLTFVDLAGSEKVKDSNSTAETLVESNNINRSLLILGNCISSLGDPKRRQGHIPYRDSKLTKLLADSLGGNGVTLMICCITPSSHHASETMNTLRYASRAKKIRTKPVIKMDPREKLILSLKKEIKVLRNENHYLRQQLEFPAKPKGQLQKENDQQFLKIMKETNGKLPPPNNILPPQEKLMQNGAKDESGLYEMLQEYMVENETLRTENSEMQVARDKQRQEQQLLYRDNEKLMRRVDELERRVNQAQSSWQAMPRQGSDHLKSRDHSPTRGSPQYMTGGQGSGGRQPPNRLPPPPDLALRDPVYTGSPPHQGYNSPTGSGSKGKQPSRGQPMKPPHRLNDALPQQRPVEQNGPYMNGHPNPAQYRHGPGSPNRSTDMRMDSRRSSQSTSSDAIRDMNEKLKQELAQLEGQIHQHTALNNRNRNKYGSQGSLR